MLSIQQTRNIISFHIDNTFVLTVHRVAEIFRKSMIENIGLYLRTLLFKLKMISYNIDVPIEYYRLMLESILQINILTSLILRKVELRTDNYPIVVD